MWAGSRNGVSKSVLRHAYLVRGIETKTLSEMGQVSVAIHNQDN